ncbi:putative GPI mannosyltransferase 3 [Rosellinia necatrix]|uniref:Mannosyltransferase n=1 Tax=Rosellinia necatrix TaxID=77044 RepID=A0A1W2TLN6_ROSNE|nr:putative GPI mannosyltransferase 3 [Rosellinia necatrix]
MTAKKASSPKAVDAKGDTAGTENSRHKNVAALVAEQAREGLAVIFAVRFANSLCVRTFFQPDEYFQVLEPAWQLLYGNDSGAWLTWEWRHALRSSIHPTVFALAYFIVDSFWASSNVPTIKAKWLLMAPKVLQTGFATLSDWYTWRLAEKLYGPGSAAAWSVLLIALLNPWQWYTATRAFSNCLETTLTAMALYYWPWELLGTGTGTEGESRDSSVLFNTQRQVNSFRMSLLLAAIAVLLRPTNILIWIAVCTLAFTRFTLGGQSPLDRRVLVILLREVFLCGSAVLGASLVCDRQYFGEWKFPPFAWLHFNVAKDLAKFYGQNDWHYYLSQGIPLLCTTVAPFVLQGFARSLDAESSYPVVTSNTLKALTFVVITTISALSLISHKEIRFIQPLLPALHILAAPHVVSFFTSPTTFSTTTCPRPALYWRRKPLLVAALLVNVVIGGYLSWFHAAAPIQVMSFLRGEFERIHPDQLSFGRASQNATLSSEGDTHQLQELFAIFLMPCHATPWRSHLVYPALSARALTCEPPLDTDPDSPERAEYQDETRQFYADPVGFLTKKVWPRDAPGEHMARYIVGFEGIETPLRMFFDSDGPGARLRIQPREVWSAWNGLFTDDERKSGRLVVWETGFYDD